MRTGVFVGLCLMALVLCVYLPQPCEAQWKELAASVLNKITGLWHNKSVKFMGRECQFHRSPKIRWFKLYHVGKFWCPGWAPFTGKAITDTIPGAVKGATKDFVRQALKEELISLGDAAIWLKS